MKQILRIFLVLAILFNASLVYGQQALPAGLKEEEFQLIQILGISDPAFGDWINNTIAFEKSKENLIRAALLDRCNKIPQNSPDAFHFDSELRASVRRIVDKDNEGILGPTYLTIFRYRSASAFWAMSVTSAEAKAELLNYRNSALGLRALQHYYALSVLEKYPHINVDISSGARLAASPILLKTYFVKSGQLAELEKVFTKVIPEVLPDFRKIKSLSEHTYEDKEWLLQISSRLEEKYEELIRTYYDILPPIESRLLEKFTRNEFFTHLNDASAAKVSNILAVMSGKEMDTKTLNDEPYKSMKIGDRTNPNYGPFIYKQLNTAFPTLKEWQEWAFTQRPRDMSYDEHLKYCQEK